MGEGAGSPHTRAPLHPKLQQVVAYGPLSQNGRGEHGVLKLSCLFVSYSANLLMFFPQNLGGGFAKVFRFQFSKGIKIVAFRVAFEIHQSEKRFGMKQVLMR